MKADLRLFMAKGDDDCLRATGKKPRCWHVHVSLKRRLLDVLVGGDHGLDVEKIETWEILERPVEWVRNTHVLLATIDCFGDRHVLLTAAMER